MIQLLPTLLLLAAQVSAGETFTATVTDVTDGDTVRFHADGRPDIAIRFGEIDAPEMNQRHGTESREFLAKLLEATERDLPESEKGLIACVPRTGYYLCSFRCSSGESEQLFGFPEI